MNAFRKDDDYVLIAELPGLERADLDIQVKGNTVRLAGKKVPKYPDKAGLHRRERPFGQFTGQ